MLSSKAERLIHALLEDGDYNFVEEYTFSDLKAENGKLLRFDFAILDEDGEVECLIEYNGRQHYIPIKKFGGAVGLQRQKYNDAHKRRYCLEHDLRLITIPYTEEDNLCYEYLVKLIDGY